MNKVILCGRLTRDPEVRYSQGAEPMAIARYTLAVDRRRTRSNDPNEQTADFINCVAWNQPADFISRFVKKGYLLCVTGRLQNRNYQGQDGQMHYVTEVVVENVEFVGGKNEGGSAPSNTDYVDEPAAAPIDEMPEYDIPTSDPYENYDKEVSLSDNDLPF